MLVALIFSFVSCSEEKKKENPDNEAMTEVSDNAAKEVVEKAIATNDNLRSVCTNTDTRMSMNLNGNESSIDIEGTIKSDLENNISYSELKYTQNGETVDMIMFIEYGENAETSYTNVSGNWFKQIIPKEEEKLAMGIGNNGSEEIAIYLRSLENFTIEDNGDCYVIEGKVEKALTKKLLLNSLKNISDKAEAMEIIAEEVIESGERIKVTTYINKESFYVMGIEANFSEIMTKMYKIAAKYSGTALSEKDGFEYSVKNEYYGHNEPLGIVIPEEAKAADLLSA